METNTTSTAGSPPIWPADRRKFSLSIDDGCRPAADKSGFLSAFKRVHDVVKSIRCVNNLTRAGEKMADQ